MMPLAKQLSNSSVLNLRVSMRSNEPNIVENTLSDYESIMHNFQSNNNLNKLEQL